MSGSFLHPGTLVRVNAPREVRFHGRLGFVDSLPMGERNTYTIRLLDTGVHILFYRDELEVAGDDTPITKDTTT